MIRRRSSPSPSPSRLLAALARARPCRLPRALVWLAAWGALGGPLERAPAEPPLPAIRWGGRTSSNNASAARGLPSDIAAVKPLWELRVGTHQYTTPTIDRGRIYIGTNDSGIDRPGIEATGGGVLLCVEQASAKLLWRLVSPRNFSGTEAPRHFNHWKCGFCSGPLVEGDRVWVVGGRGEVLCLDRQGQADGNDGPFTGELDYMGVRGDENRHLGPTDGDIVWRYDLLEELAVIPHDVCGSTLLSVGEWIFACTSNGQDDRHRTVPSPRAPSLIALEKRTGRLVAVDGEEIGTRMFHGHWSSPVAGRVDGEILVFFGGGDGVLYAFRLPRAGVEGVQTLEKAWSHDANPPDYRVRDGERLAYSRHNKKTPDGPSEIIGSPVFLDGRLYVAIGQSPVHGVGQGQLSCLDAATGRAIWTSRLVDRTLATPSIAGGLLFISDYTGNLHAFDARRGERLWVHSLQGHAWTGSTFVADGKVYAGTESGLFWVLEAGREKRVFSRVRLRSATTTATAADGVLYVPTQKRLLALPGAGTPAATASGPAPERPALSATAASRPGR